VTSYAEFFSTLRWQPDRFFFKDIEFLIEQEITGTKDADALYFYKRRGLVEEYGRFWGTREGFLADRVLELGTWTGASIVFWSECLKPRRLVGVDALPVPTNRALAAYLNRESVQGRVALYGNTDQANRRVLHDLIGREFSGQLDLCVDDASHLYAPTRASFEAVFPRLRAGGLYIIEDWAWCYWRECKDRFPYAGQEPLTTLIAELVHCAGAAREIVREVSIRPGFLVVERGDGHVPETGFPWAVGQ
jgi:hypothetical protein